MGRDPMKAQSKRFIAVTRGISTDGVKFIQVVDVLLRFGGCPKPIPLTNVKKTNKNNIL
jgi:hypothetical protein